MGGGKTAAEIIAYVLCHSFSPIHTHTQLHQCMITTHVSLDTCTPQRFISETEHKRECVTENNATAENDTWPRVFYYFYTTGYALREKKHLKKSSEQSTDCFKHLYRNEGFLPQVACRYATMFLRVQNTACKLTASQDASLGGYSYRPSEIIVFKHCIRLLTH